MNSALVIVSIVVVVSIGSFFVIQNDMFPELLPSSEFETNVIQHNPQERSRELKNDESSSVDIGLPGMLKKSDSTLKALPQYSASPSQPIPQKSSYSSGVSWFGSSSFDFEKFERELRQAQSEEELYQIIQEAIETPEYLQACAKFYEEAQRATERAKELARSGVDLYTDPEAKEQARIVGSFLNETFCMAVKDLWLEQ